MAHSVTPPVLHIKDLQVQFTTDSSTVMAVQGLNLKVPRGEILAIVGESGSGKSVSCLAAMGLIPNPPGQVLSGQILFHDRDSGEAVDLTQVSTKQMQVYRGGQMGMIFQEPMSALNPVQTCGAQIIEAIRMHADLSETAARRRALALLREVQLLPTDDELAEEFRSNGAALGFRGTPTPRDLHQAIRRHKKTLLGRYPHQLSGGQLQRIMIAMALSCDPQLLIADEPTTALDVTVQATILQLLKELSRQRGMSMIFVSHDLGVVSQIADSIAVMYQGRVVEYNNTRELFEAPEHPYTKGLLACRPRLSNSFTYLPTVNDFMSQTEAPDGRVILKPKPVDVSIFSRPRSRFAGDPPGASPGAPLVQVKYLTVEYPIKTALGQPKRTLKAVNNVSFDILSGETLGLVGESGCGKSTLARTLLRLLQPTAGSIIFEGQDIAWMKEKRLRGLRRDMQIVFQDPYSALNPRGSVGKAIMEPLKIHRQGDARSQRDRAAQLLERVGLSADALDRFPHEFSGGQRQRICIARALALNPRFIICDESVSALDVSVQAQVLNLLKALQSELGLTYLFISHDLSVVKFMSDRILVMNQGQIEESGSANEIYANPQQEYTKKLIAAIPQVRTYLETA